MLVEVMIKRSDGDHSTFFLSEISNHDAEDVRAQYLEDKMKPTDQKSFYESIPEFTPMNPDILLRPCVDEDFWGTPVGAEFNKEDIMKFREGEKEILEKLPKWDWNNIMIYVDKAGVQNMML